MAIDLVTNRCLLPGLQFSEHCRSKWRCIGSIVSSVYIGTMSGMSVLQCFKDHGWRNAVNHTTAICHVQLIEMVVCPVPPSAQSLH